MVLLASAVIDCGFDRPAKPYLGECIYCCVNHDSRGTSFQHSRIASEFRELTLFAVLWHFRILTTLPRDDSTSSDFIHVHKFKLRKVNMELSSVPAASHQYQPEIVENVNANDANKSGVSWAAVIAGAFVAAALSLILLALGAGMGLSAVSPWSSAGESASAVGAGAVIWLIVIQIIAFAMGGYLAGRLRTKWAGVHTDEIYFRDTAHGFLAWAVSIVVTAAFLTSAAATMVGSTRPGAQDAGRTAGPNEYFVDSLFRTDHPSPDGISSSLRDEASVILAKGIRQGELPAADKSYLTSLVAAKTGLAAADADKRVSEVFDADRQFADAARKAVAHSLYWLFLALLIGAFCASLAATIGGRQRDHMAAL